jgi:hypothetical protein
MMRGIFACPLKLILCSSRLIIGPLIAEAGRPNILANPRIFPGKTDQDERDILNAFQMDSCDFIARPAGLRRPGRGESGGLLLAVGDAHTVAPKKDGTRWAWGMNQDNQLENGTNKNSLTSVRIPY